MAYHINKYWWRPLLRIDIQIPFIRIMTQLMNESPEALTIQYLMVYIEVYKWHFDFRLYNTWERIA
jgi:hypothetical protein